MKALDDTKIIDLFFERDETAIRYASEKYGNRLRSLSHSIVKDRQTAEECENDTYMEAWDIGLSSRRSKVNARYQPYSR